MNILSLFKQRNMKKFWLLFLLLYAARLHAQTDTGSKYIQHTSTVYITHVNVINVITQKIDADQTVIIDRDRITAVAPSKKTKVPAKAMEIDGAGKYLMPGMTDAH